MDAALPTAQYKCAFCLRSTHGIISFDKNCLSAIHDSNKDLWVQCCQCKCTFHADCASEASMIDKFYQFEFSRRAVRFDCCHVLSNDNCTRIKTACIEIKVNSSIGHIGMYLDVFAQPSEQRHAAMSVWKRYVSRTKGNIPRYLLFRSFRSYRLDRPYIYKEPRRQVECLKSMCRNVFTDYAARPYISKEPRRQVECLKSSCRNVIRDYAAAVTFDLNMFIYGMQSYLEQIKVPWLLYQYIILDDDNYEKLTDE